MNPKFEMRLRDNAEVEKAIAINFNDEIAQMFSAFPVFVMKVSSHPNYSFKPV